MSPIKEFDKHWIRSINGKLTFLGVLESYYEDVAVRWIENSTRNKNNLDYNNRIIPSIPDHDNKSIDQFVKEDFDKVIENVEAAYAASGGGNNGYRRETVHHYRRLIYLVINAAVKHGLCKQILWGSVFMLPETTGAKLLDERIKELTRHKRSFTPKEEIRIVKELFKDPLHRGELIGLLLMFVFGTRNAEACAGDYGDIKPMEEHPEDFALWIYKTTVEDTNRVKGSGKTQNADRVIPVLRFVYAFLLERKKHLAHLIETGELVLSPEEFPDGIDSLPIACVGHDYTTRCSTTDLTAAARELFQRIGLNAKQLAYIESSLSEPAVILKEKEATAYLFRRNFATVLKILGLNDSEICYILGHDIEDARETRNEYVNEERLYEIKKKMEHRPLLGSEKCVSEHLNLYGMSITQSDAPFIHLRIPATAGTLSINVQTREPSDAIKIELKCSGKKNITTVLRHKVLEKYPLTINMLNAYHKNY